MAEERARRRRTAGANTASRDVLLVGPEAEGAELVEPGRDGVPRAVGQPLARPPGRPGTSARSALDPRAARRRRRLASRGRRRSRRARARASCTGSSGAAGCSRRRSGARAARARHRSSSACVGSASAARQRDVRRPARAHRAGASRRR